MDLSNIGSMNINLRNMEMKSMWEMRKRNKDFHSKGQQRLDEMFESLYGADAEEKRGTDQKLSDIMQKYYTGGKLTAEERDYLRVKNPQAYNDLVAEEQEQKAYEQELRRCKTKEEVERLKMTRLGESLSTVNEIKNNPNIPTEKKLALIAREKRRTDNVNESTQKFIESGRYAKLPTEAEKALAEKKEAEREELRAEAVQEAAKEQSEMSTDASEESPSAEESKAAERIEKQKLKELELDFLKPDSVLSQAERYTESAEERKVRQAKARAAYAPAPASDFTLASTGVDKKA